MCSIYLSIDYRLSENTFLVLGSHITGELSEICIIRPTCFVVELFMRIFVRAAAQLPSWGEQPRMANKIIDKNEINKEPNNKQTAQDKGVGSTNLLEVDILNAFPLDGELSWIYSK